MSIADIWDRFFWSGVVAIFVGIVWLKFIDSTVSFTWTGFVVVQVIAWSHFAWGIKKLKRQCRCAEEEAAAVEAPHA